jgi:hypothetical protein
VAPSRFLDLFDMVDRKDAQGYALSTTAPANGVPKGVNVGSLVAELEPEYLRSVAKADWSKLADLDKGGRL